MLVLSPRANRTIRRFIDRNFYANRYDYRREWERVSGAITPTARSEDIARQIEGLIRTVFDAERVAIYMRREVGDSFIRIHGPDPMPPELDGDNTLVAYIEREGQPLVFREAALDLDLVPAAAENVEAIGALGAAVCAPLMVGELLVGLMWLSERRNREPYSSEDIAFLEAMARQLAAALWFARIAEQLAETRQLDSLNRLSTYVLHDIKNHVSGLSLVVDNARRHLANPEFQRDALAVVERTVRNLKELMSQVSGVARSPDVHPEPCDVRELLTEATMSAGLEPGARDGIEFALESHATSPVSLDRRLLLRVLVNLLTNAREALGGPGKIELAANTVPTPDGGWALSLVVRDTGRGMSEEFVRTSLFKPFSTTKSAGLGLGLTQVRTIVEAHGGTIQVHSRAGQGTTFEVRIPASGPIARARDDVAAASAGSGASAGTGEAGIQHGT